MWHRQCSGAGLECGALQIGGVTLVHNILWLGLGLPHPAAAGPPVWVSAARACALNARALRTWVVRTLPGAMGASSTPTSTSAQPTVPGRPDLTSWAHGMGFTQMLCLPLSFKVVNACAEPSLPMCATVSAGFLVSCRYCVLGAAERDSVWDANWQSGGSAPSSHA